MRAFQIVVDRRPAQAVPVANSSLRGVVDVIVDGTNITAKIGQDYAIPLLRDLAYAAADLATRRHTRATVRFYDQRDAWAIGLERVNDDVLVSVFQVGEMPKVPVHARPVPGVALLRGIASAIDGVLGAGNTVPLLSDLEAVQRFLGQLEWQVSSHPDPLIEVCVEGLSDAPVSFSTDLTLRVHEDEPVSTDVERNDLHSLLFRGPLTFRVGETTRSLGAVHLFLVAEVLVSEAAAVLRGWEAGRVLNRRCEISGVGIAVRLSAKGVFSLTIGGQQTGGLRNAPTFPSVSVVAFVEAVLAFARGIVRPVLRNDRTQRSNLRMRHFRDQVRTLSVALREAVREDAKVNDAPESYRAFAAALPERRVSDKTWGHSRLRFKPAWEAAVPGIDLRSVFLYQDRLVVAGARELAAIEKREGLVLWRTPIDRGVSIAAPKGLVRLSPPGALSFHDLMTGEVTMSMQLAARNGGLPAGAVVNVPGLPRLVILSEGERHLTAIDYVSGEVRWRYALGRGRPIKVRRAGKLLVVSSSDQTLAALDIQSGETVWRVRDKRRFTRPISYDRDDLIVVTGDGSSSARGSEELHAFDPWTGQRKWSRAIGAGLPSHGAPLVHNERVVVVTQDRRGLGLSAFDRSDGEPRWRVEPGFVSTTSAWITVDDAMIINSDSGSIVSLDMRDGSVRWRRAGEQQAMGDAPRTMEPILRSGALFVPQRHVEVLRPHDGEKLGEVEADLVPDLVRVDEACHVVVVEESGHVAAFAPGPHLTLVKS